jgi:putative flippase GtrA
MSAELARFVRFGLVGAINTALTLVTFALLTHLGVAAAPASALAFATGAVNGYLLNRTWTFHARGGAATLTRYVAVQGLGALCSGAGVALVSTDLALHRLPAECLVIPFVTLLTYTLARRVVFRPARAQPVM